MTGILARLLGRLVALVAIVALLVGAPWALWKLGAPLLPDRIPTAGQIWAGLTQRDTGQVFLGSLVVIGLLAWACYAICLLAEIVARLAHRTPIRLPGLHAPQAAVAVLVGLLIAGTLALDTAPPVLAATLPALPHPPAAVLLAAPTPSSAPTVHRATDPVLAGAHGHPVSHHRTGPVWTVTRGDTLWSIAERTLGNGARWPEIAALNEGRPQPDGHTFASADWLQIGWHLHLPAGAHLPQPDSGSDREAVTVHPGDTLSAIAQRTLGDGDLYPELAAANHLADPDLIYPGQIIRIPQPAHRAGQAEAKPAPQQHHPRSLTGSARDSSTTAPAAHTDPGTQMHSAHHREPTDPPERPAPRATGPTAAEATPPRPGGRPAVPESPPSVAVQPGPPTDAPAAPMPPTSGSAHTMPVSPARPTRSEPAASVHDDQVTWVLGGLTTMAAAIAWAGLLLARRRAEQSRRPGQRPAVPSPETARCERALRERSAPADPTRIDAALRRMTPAAATGAPHGFAMIEIGADALRLHPARPAPPPPPFTGDEHTWTVPLDGQPDNPGESLAAIPAMVTLGTTADGTAVAVDLEQLGALHVDGDPAACRRLINHMILELSQMPWCDGIHLYLPGRDDRYRRLDDERIDLHADLATAVKSLSRHAASTRELLADTTIAAARAAGDSFGAWEPHILIDDGSAPREGLGLLAGILQSGPSSAVALVTTSPVDSGIAHRVRVDRDGTLDLPGILDGVHASAVGLTDEEMDHLLDLFAARTVDPAEADDRPGTTATPDGSGGADDPRTRASVAICGDGADGPETGTPALTGSDDPCGAETPIRARQPADPAADRREVPSPTAAAPGEADGRPGDDHRLGPPREDSIDPTLDSDLAEWREDPPRRPKIAILGAVTVATLGPAPTRQPVRLLEMAVYLALHPRGVSPDKFATDLWPENRRPAVSGCRADMSRLRAWFGSPADGEPFVRSAVSYRITDRLLDSELFARLAARAKARAAHGDPAHALEDVQAALDLVRGPILPEADAYGYHWLANPDRMEDRTLPLMVVDAAHAAVDLALDADDVTAAAKAAKTGRLVDAYSSIPLCDLIRVARAEGDHQAAVIWSNLLLQVNDVDRPEDLPAPARDLAVRVLRKPPRQPRTAGGRP